MKLRNDFVTNSSSSSFVVINNSYETITSEKVIEKLFNKILEDAEGRFKLGPNESVVIECGDSMDDGPFENFIHYVFSEYGYSSMYDTSEVNINFIESHH